MDHSFFIKLLLLLEMSHTSSYGLSSTSRNRRPDVVGVSATKPAWATFLLHWCPYSLLCLSQGGGSASPRIMKRLTTGGWPGGGGGGGGGSTTPNAKAKASAVGCRIGGCRLRANWGASCGGGGGGGWTPTATPTASFCSCGGCRATMAGRYLPRKVRLMTPWSFCLRCFRNLLTVLMPSSTLSKSAVTAASSSVVAPVAGLI